MYRILIVTFGLILCSCVEGPVGPPGPQGEPSDSGGVLYAVQTGILNINDPTVSLDSNIDRWRVQWTGTIDDNLSSFLFYVQTSSGNWVQVSQTGLSDISGPHYDPQTGIFSIRDGNIFLTDYPYKIIMFGILDDA